MKKLELTSEERCMGRHGFIKMQERLRVFMVTILILFVVNVSITSAQTNILGDLKEFKVRANLHSVLNKIEKANWEFESNRYGQIKILLKGDWRVMWFNSASQNFNVSVNGKRIYDQDLVGERTLDYTLDSLEYKNPIKVEVTMGLGKWSNNASGSVEVICYEGQVGRFFIEKVEYDFTKAVSLDPEIIKSDGKSYKNNTSTQQDTGFDVTFTTTESAHWEKTFKSTTSVEFTVGYSAGSAPGFNWALKLMQQIESGWSQGGATITSSSSTDRINVKIPPYTEIQVYYIKTQNHLRVPYKMTGYYLQSEGKRKAATISDFCVFDNTQRVDVAYDSVPPSNDDKPVVLKTYTFN